MNNDADEIEKGRRTINMLRKLFLYLLVAILTDLLYAGIRYLFGAPITSILEELFFFGLFIVGLSLIILFGGFASGVSKYEGHAVLAAWTNRKFDHNIAIKDFKNTAIDIGKDKQFVFFFGLFNIISFAFSVFPFIFSNL